MTAPHADQVIDDYMARLEGALATAPESRRRELIDEMRTHVAEARGRLSDETDADVLNILDRLGDPAETAAAELGRTAAAPAPGIRGPVFEIVTIALLVFFWPVGVIMLWISAAWTTREKLIGTLVPPGGYLGTMLLGVVMALGVIGTACRTATDESGRVLSSTCPSGGVQVGFDVVAAALLILYVVGPVFTAAYLALRLRRRLDPSGRGIDVELSSSGFGVADQPATSA